MIRDHSHRENRSAFTLVELMVVILIIAILVSLLAAAVMKVMAKIPEVQTSTEIAQLSLSLEAFMGDYGLTSTPPSALVLNEFAPLGVGDSKTVAFLQQAFGRTLGPTDWNGNGVIDGPAPPSGWILQGQQCLVFYLGGIPNTLQMATTPGTPPSPQGFSPNPANPALITPGIRTKGPYFPFVTTRLVPVPANGGFFYYQDPWQVKVSANGFGPMPYAYFSSSGNNNGYSSADINGFSFLDCNGITFTDALGLHFPLPYWTAQSPVAPFLPSAYMNSNTFQIISAGKDGKFGYSTTPPSPFPPPTGLLFGNWWLPTSGAVGTGADDQSNFSSTILGAGQN